MHAVRVGCFASHTHTHIHLEKYLQMHASGLTVAGWKISTFRPTLTDTLIIFAIYTLPADFFFFFSPEN